MLAVEVRDELRDGGGTELLTLADQHGPRVAEQRGGHEVRQAVGAHLGRADVDDVERAALAAPLASLVEQLLGGASQQQLGRAGQQADGGRHQPSVRQTSMLYSL